MADSLVLANQIELIGQDAGVPSTIPSCAGAIFRLAPDWDLSSPQPVSDIIGTLILDGERPFGRRASNRTVKLPINIEVPWSANAANPRQTLAAAREVLLSAIDQQVWTLTWTRDGGDPMVLDCFRALPSVVTYELANETALVTELEISFQALPYGRADQQTQVAFAAPVPGTPAPPPSPVVLDGYSSITGAQWGQSGQCIVGPFTAYWDPGAGPAFRPDGRGLPLVYGWATLPSPVNLTGLTGLSMWAGHGATSAYYPNLEWRGRTRAYFAFELADASGNVLQFQTSRKVPVSGNVFAPAWIYVTAAIPQNDTSFDYTHVAAYRITITNRNGELRWVHAYLDALTAQPPSKVVGPASTRGSIYQLAGVTGTSHAPVSLQFQQVPTAGTPTTLTGNGSYTVPAGTVTLKVEAVGAGGAGASMTTAGVGGGGAGAEYAREDAVPVTPGQVIPYACGLPGTSGTTPADGTATVFGGGAGQLAVIANGGSSAALNGTAGGSGGTGSANRIAYPGGSGRTASGSVGGGGGSSAGNSGPGQAPMGTSATVFTAAGSGTWTCPPGVTSILAECWGAGGGGGAGSNSYSYGAGGGAGGEYAAQTVPVTPGHVYSYNVGAGGSGGAASSSGNNGAAGGGTVFTADSGNAVTAHGGSAGATNYSGYKGGGGGSGGTGSSAATSYGGGDGGTGKPYGGGGGSSAGPSSYGNDGDGYADPGAAPSGGGSGGAGRTGNGAAYAGSAPGGGGGGSYYPSYAGGSGATGQIRLTYPGGAPTNNGAAAVTGGGAGGNGGPSANTAGSAGSAPGGGGGGADSTGTSEAGGAGGAGRIIVTPYSSAAFKTLVAHRPGPDAPQSLNPLVPVGNGSDTPNGATQYAVPSLVSGVNARFGGTYTWMLVNYTWNNPTVQRTITVTVTQAEYAGGPTYSTSVSTTVTPSTGVTNGLVTVGELTLPYKDIAPDNQSAIFTVSVTDTNSSDRFLDAIALDTTGQTVILSTANGYVSYMVDEPDPDRDLGRVLGSQYGRPDAISVIDAATLSGGPLTVDPSQAGQILLTYAVEGSPAVAMSYFSRFFLDRV